MHTPISESQFAPENKVCERVPKIHLFFGKRSSFPHVRDWQTISRKQHRALKLSTLSSLSREVAACP